MDKKYLKWSLMGAFGSLVLVFIGVALFLLIPSETAQTVLGVATMLLILLAGLASLLSMALTTIDILQSGTMSGLRKVLYLAAMWLIFGVLACAAYYFIEKKG